MVAFEALHIAVLFQLRVSICHGLQVEKSGLITGSRLGADNEYQFDELEVLDRHSHCLLLAEQGSSPNWSDLYLQFASFEAKTMGVLLGEPRKWPCSGSHSQLRGACALIAILRYTSD